MKLIFTIHETELKILYKCSVMIDLYELEDLYEVECI